jgi:hypothetical protein
MIRGSLGWLLRVLAVAEVAGGAVLVVRVARAVWQGAIGGPFLAAAGLIGVVGLLVIVAGIALWRGRTWGAVVSLAWQLLQVPHLATAPLTYYVALPASVAAGLGLDGRPHGTVIPLPGLEITPDDFAPDPWVGLNVVALAAVVVLLLALRRGRRAPRDAAARAATPL